MATRRGSANCGGNGASHTSDDHVPLEDPFIPFTTLATILNAREVSYWGH